MTMLTMAAPAAVTTTATSAGRPAADRQARTDPS